MAATMTATVGAIGRTWTEADIPDQAGRVAVVTDGCPPDGRPARA